MNYFVSDDGAYSDYHPFGMVMPVRNWTPSGTEKYRYAYNGIEQDNEVSGNGNSYTTEFRQYDPRLGRWKSLDPLMAKYPMMSPYVAFNNNPVYYTDLYGLASEGGPGDDGKGSVEEIGEQEDSGKDRQKMYLFKRIFNENVRQAFKDQKTLGGKVYVKKRSDGVYAYRSGVTK